MLVLGLWFPDRSGLAGYRGMEKKLETDCIIGDPTVFMNQDPSVTFYAVIYRRN